jgi:hypothetical protein
LAALEQENPVPSHPKRVSLTYLIDLKAGMIVDVEASEVNKTAELELQKR